MNYTAVDFCSGGGGVGAAFVEEGLSYRSAVEYDPENMELSRLIANVHDNNFKRYGCTMFRGTVQDAAAHEFSFIENEPLVAHISPPCQNFSVAKVDGQEQTRDIEIAKAAIKFVELKRPRFFTLEEVQAYRHSDSWALIRDALVNMGYGVTFGVLNAHDYGVPQDRERFIVIADREGRAVGLPAPGRPRLGWWHVLAERIDALEPSIFTTMQALEITQLHKLYPTTEAFLVQRKAGRNCKLIIRHQFEPCFTITKSMFSDYKKTNNGLGANRASFLDVWVRGRTFALSIKDVAALQTFPDWYEFSGANNVDGALLGNAVPTNFYRAILQHILLFV